MLINVSEVVYNECLTEAKFKLRLRFGGLDSYKHWQKCKVKVVGRLSHQLCLQTSHWVSLLSGFD